MTPVKEQDAGRLCGRVWVHLLAGIEYLATDAYVVAPASRQLIQSRFFVRFQGNSGRAWDVR
jgi:hypothetical protein